MGVICQHNVLDDSDLADFMKHHAWFEGDEVALPREDRVYLLGNLTGQTPKRRRVTQSKSDLKVLNATIVNMHDAIVFRLHGFPVLVEEPSSPCTHLPTISREQDVFPFSTKKRSVSSGFTVLSQIGLGLDWVGLEDSHEVLLQKTVERAFQLADVQL